ncbi:filamentous hemagglutinin N-terminal domain-containing protein [Scytonema hofmannii FACHB-248]|uniref:Filamentous hemagglutinin N-terminal domain-containing protein n=1 Tax=Scytonema hofmannii FACHB-248 TaxID=1842502 RepID=A0ABR8GK82_9CYAN|nr:MULTISPECIES: filamentous hemagglutinin N-terminal domain-containing protein [Nostocales]MBD2603799.1 filamentous hemagglutinin N-terminal domain-containing protein [Scytonema hofmannii FACHB-248]
MTNKPNWLQLLIFSFITFASTPAIAQITPDNTLGAENSRFTPNVLINGASADQIDGGATRGSNLFHSFTQFSINDGQRVYFSNPIGVENILTRVTGKEASNIFGTLGVNGAANLFLINPNGILFGKNAQLDIRGSFLGTTANQIQFGNQGIFSATNPAAPPLLTVQPSGLLFNQINSGAIAANQALLSVAPEKNLTLVGGDINLNRSILEALGGRVELAAIAGTATVGLNPDTSLSIPTDLPQADVLLNQSQIDVRSGNGGSVRINARNLNLTNSFVLAGIASGQNAGGQAGDISINAIGAIKLDAGAIANLIFENAFGNSGNININTGSLSLTNGGQLDASVFGQGNAGDITINARDTVSLEGVNPNGLASTIFTEVVSGASGNGGDIRITTGSLSATNGGSLVSNTRGRGNAGNIFINAREAVTFAGRGPNNTSGAYSRVTQDAVGRGGNIEITTGSLSLTNTALLVTSTNGQGDAGNVIINARDRVLLDGTRANESFIPSSILSSVGTRAVGNSGDVRITAGSLSVLNGSELNATTRGQGNAGNIILQVGDRTVFDGGTALSSVVQGAIGTGGNVEISTGSLAVINEAVLAASTNGQGNAGSVRINSRDRITLDRSGISSNVRREAVGNGGNIDITTGSLIATNESQLNTFTSGQGNAGNITVNARDIVSLDTDTILLSGIEPGGTGKGGNITITADSLSVTNGASLNARTRGGGNAGSISITARNSALFSGTGASGFSSGAFSPVRENGVGRGGNVEITTGSLVVNNGAQLAAGTQGRGDSGSVIINARDSVVLGGGTADRQFSSAIFSNVDEGAIGRGGNVEITTGSLLVSNGGQLLSATEGQGDAGNVIINARDRITFDGSSADGRFVSGPFSSVQENAVGNGGDIRISTKNLSLTNGAQLVAATRGNGNAGNVIVNAQDSILLDGIDNRGRPSGIFTSALNTATGRGSNITINTNSLQLRNLGEINAATANNQPGGNISIRANTVTASTGGNVATTTFAQGKAGNIRLNVTDSVTLTNPGSGLFADTTRGSSGDGGSIFIAPQTLTLTDKARIFVGSRGTGQGGNIQIQARNLRLDRAQISAETGSTDGGNINLQVDDILLMRDGSIISATAGTESQEGNGGNITIDAAAIIAVPKENSDIRANAVRGRGGNVTIKTNGLFGIAPASFPTAQSDITASSQLGIQGQINIIQPDVQPTQGIIELPNQVLDASNQIAQDCPRGRNAKKPLGNFIVTGRGIPPNATQPLNGTPNLPQLATLDFQSASTKPNTSSTPNLPPTSENAIIEAQGWVKTPDGKIMLVAQVPTATPNAITTSAACPVSR